MATARQVANAIAVVRAAGSLLGDVRRSHAGQPAQAVAQIAQVRAAHGDPLVQVADLPQRDRSGQWMHPVFRPQPCVGERAIGLFHQVLFDPSPVVRQR